MERISSYLNMSVSETDYCLLKRDKELIVCVSLFCQKIADRHMSGSIIE